MLFEPIGRSGEFSLHQCEDSVFPFDHDIEVMLAPFFACPVLKVLGPPCNRQPALNSNPFLTIKNHSSHMNFKTNHPANLDLINTFMGKTTETTIETILSNDYPK